MVGRRGAKAHRPPRRFDAHARLIRTQQREMRCALAFENEGHADIVGVTTAGTERGDAFEDDLFSVEATDHVATRACGKAYPMPIGCDAAQHFDLRRAEASGVEMTNSEVIPQ